MISRSLMTFSATGGAAQRGTAGFRTIVTWTVVLLAAFAYRLGFGLCSEFFFEDETQIFLIGLRHHATGAWPYFGADVVWTHSQIPGALQGLLVGLPMDLVPAPEAPFVLLNLLSLASLALLAWYMCRRLPELPRWLVWGWLLFIPWTLCYGTHVMNPDYVLCAAIAFFVGFFETAPRLRRGLIPAAAAHVMMGAAVFWIMQIHMSWPLLGPFVVYAWWSAMREGPRRLAVALVAFLAGSALTGSVLLPTFLKYGLLAGGGGIERNLTFHVETPLTLFSTLARLFSFASLEISRFLGLDTARRLQFLLAHAWLIPFAAIVFVAGLAQPLWMALSWFRTRSPHAEWSALKWLVVSAVLITYFSYWFVIEPPQAHAFYSLAPVGFIYAFYCWTFIDSRRWRTVAAIVLGSSIVYHAGMIAGRAPERSLYKNREVVAAAVLRKNPDLLAHRRLYAIEGAPPPDVIATDAALSEVRLVSATWSRGPWGMLLWTMTVRNESRANAYRDIYYDATYRDAADRMVGQHYDIVAEILQPGQSVTLTGVNHGFIEPFKTADITLLRAERLMPLSAVR
jgi:hypothetical protein